MSETLYVGLPRRPGLKYPGEDDGKIWAITPSRQRRTRFEQTKLSLLNKAFNTLWADARNRKRKGELITRWGLQHDDIVPEAGWADVQMDEMDLAGAEVISAVVPLKDDRGVTSTGVRNAKTGEVRRLTMTELFRLPETFGVEDLIQAGINVAGDDQDKLLIVNTGLWVCRFDRSWVETFDGFRCQDILREKPDGSIEAVCLPEDWIFSEWCWRNGIKVIATRKTALAHVELPTEPIGENNRAFRNDCVWGEWETDHGDL